MKMDKIQARSTALLFAAAFIWGTAFAAQSVGLAHIGPFTFSALRCLIGSAVLLPFIFVLEKWKGRDPGSGKENQKELRKGGLVCGLVFCVATNLQQVALLYAGVGKSGFLTALYIVIVPVIGMFAGQKLSKKLCAAVLCAVAGLYLLCMKEGSFYLGVGDVLLLLGAAAFAVHILVIDYYSGRINGIKLSCLQMFVSGMISSVVMLLFESPSPEAICAAAGPLLYVGVLSSGVAYTFQIVGQKGSNPVVTSLIMSLESVISALAGWIVLGQALSGREMAGCAVMFLAIILAQL